MREPQVDSLVANTVTHCHYHHCQACPATFAIQSQWPYLLRLLYSGAKTHSSPRADLLKSNSWVFSTCTYFSDNFHGRLSGRFWSFVWNFAAGWCFVSVQTNLKFFRFGAFIGVVSTSVFSVWHCTLHARQYCVLKEKAFSSFLVISDKLWSVNDLQLSVHPFNAHIRVFWQYLWRNTWSVVMSYFGWNLVRDSWFLPFLIIFILKKLLQRGSRNVWLSTRSVQKSYGVAFGIAHTILYCSCDATPRLKG